MAGRVLDKALGYNWLQLKGSWDLKICGNACMVTRFINMLNFLNIFSFLALHWNYIWSFELLIHISLIRSFLSEVLYSPECALVSEYFSIVIVRVAADFPFRETLSFQLTFFP